MGFESFDIFSDAVEQVAENLFDNSNPAEDLLEFSASAWSEQVLSMFFTSFREFVEWALEHAGEIIIISVVAYAGGYLVVWRPRRGRRSVT